MNSLRLFVVVLGACLALACSSTQISSAHHLLVSNTQIEVFNYYGELVHQGRSTDSIQLSSQTYTQSKYLIRFLPKGHVSRTLSVSVKQDELYFSNINVTNTSHTLVIDPVTGAMFTGSDELSQHVGSMATGTFKVMSLHEIPVKYATKLTAL